jgi:hypothetical protein
MSLISGNATFGADAINCSSNSILGAAAFIDTAINQGTVSAASFSGTASNEGTVVSAVFVDGAVNVGTLTSGTFLGAAVNSGVVTVAEFFGTASNAGVIVEAAKFADTSSNVGTVSGSAIFTDTSVSNGVVEGSVQIGVSVTQGENETLTETPTAYTQPDGFFPNAHYFEGSKSAPADYETVVYQVGAFWYKYDSSGNGSLATGNYSDGTSTFTFANGIKGNSSTPSLNGPYSTGYFLNGTIDNSITGTYTAQDDNVPYYYSAGVAYADGIYPEFYILNGTPTDSATPLQASNNDWYTYSAGVGSPATGLFEDSGLWYEYTNGSRSLYTNLTPFDDNGIWKVYDNGGLVNYTSNAPVYESGSWYTYNDGVRSSVDGVFLYSNGDWKEYVAGNDTPVTANDSIFDDNGVWKQRVQGNDTPQPYTNLTPVYESGSWYSYNSGTKSSVDGTFFFDNGDWYEYVAGNDTPVIANGSIFDDNGTWKQNVQGNDTPQVYTNLTPVDESGTWYVYDNGSKNLAEGRYSNGAYVAGEADTGGTYNSAAPMVAQDDNKYYVYNNGEETPAEGHYSNGAYVAGEPDTSGTYDSAVPVNAQDNSQRYTYLAGEETVAEGYYSSGSYVDGYVDYSSIYDTATPVATQDDNLYYIYSAGTATPYTNATPTNEGGTLYVYDNGTRTALNELVINNNSYYSTDSSFNNGSTVLYDITGAFASGSGFDDLDGDTVSENWSINGSGVISWTAMNEIVIGGYTYYSETAQADLVSGTSILYDDVNKSMTAVITNVFADATNDGTPDQINTNELGVISWTPLNHIITLPEHTYYSETPQANLVSGTSVLRNADGTLAASISGPNYNDVNGDGTPENWSTNENGVISWTGLNAIAIGATYTYYSETATSSANLVNGESVLRNADGALASQPAPNYNNLGNDANPENWSIDGSTGVISWTELTEYTLTVGFDPQTTPTSFYYEGLYFEDGIVMYNADASVLVSQSGLVDSQTQWSTNESGVITTSPYTP